MQTQIKTKKLTCTLAAIAAFLLAALLAVCLPWTPGASVKKVKALQSGDKYYAENVENTIDIAYLGDVIANTAPNLTNCWPGMNLGSGAYDHRTRDLYNEMMPIKEVEGADGNGIRKNNLVTSDNGFSFAPFRVNDRFLDPPDTGTTPNYCSNLNEMKFTFSFKFAGASGGILSFGNYDCSTTKWGTWNYRLYINQDGNVALATPHLIYSDNASWTEKDVLGTGTDGNTEDFGEFKPGEIYIVEYTVQRLFDSEGAVITACGTDGSAGMRQTVKITSQFNSDTDFTEKTLSADFSDQTYYAGYCGRSDYNDDTYNRLESVNDAADKIGMGYNFMLAVPKDSEDVYIASANYADDYKVADFEGNEETIRKQDISQVIPSMKSAGMTSEDSFYTADGAYHENIWDVKLTDDIINRRIYMKLDVGKKEDDPLKEAVAPFTFYLNKGDSIYWRTFRFSNRNGQNWAMYMGRTPLTLGNDIYPGGYNNGTNRNAKFIFAVGVDNYHSAKTGHNYQIAHVYTIDAVTGTEKDATTFDALEAAANIGDIKHNIVQDANQMCMRFIMEQPEEFYNDFRFSGGTDGYKRQFDIDPLFYSREYQVSVDGEDTTVTYGQAYNLKDKLKAPDYFAPATDVKIVGGQLTKTGEEGSKGSLTLAELEGDKWEYELDWNDTNKGKIVLESNAQPIDYKIKYHVGDKVYNDTTVLSGSARKTLSVNDSEVKIEDLYVPTAEDKPEGKQFFGWFTDAAYGDEDALTEEKLNVQSLVPDANKNDPDYAIELYARIDVGHLVKFQYPDGTSDQKAIVGNDTITFAEFLKDMRGYGNITGWEKKGSGEDEWNAVSGETDQPNADATYRAKAELLNYPITYTLGDGGVNYADAPATYNIHSDDITFGVPTRPGCFFVRWHVGNLAGTPIEGIQTGEMTGDLALFAEFVENTLPTELSFSAGRPAALPVPHGLIDGNYSVTLTDAESNETDLTGIFSYTFATGGTYKLTYTVTMPFAVYTHDITVTVAKPVITVTGDYNASYTAGTVLELIAGSVNVSGAEVNIGVTCNGNTVGKSADGKTVTLTEVGTYVVTYSFNGADSVTKTFTVTEAPASGEEQPGENEGKEEGGCKGCGSKSAAAAASVFALLGASLIFFVKRR